MEPKTVIPTAKPPRIVFIDVLRAYAILMMLQGHFVDTLLAADYRQAEYPLYVLWAYMRGMTAPIFFTVTGLVFTYLLLKDGRPLAENKRVKKGLRRGVYLLGVGYLLKMNFGALLIGEISPWFWAADVLHIIGFALIGLIAVVALREWIGGSLLGWMLACGAGMFFCDPYFTETTWYDVPRLFAHYLTRDFGSNFTLVPWLGFAFFGGALGYVVSKRPQWAFTHWFPAFLLILGLTLTKGSWQMLVNLYALTGWENLPVLFNNNYLFWRLGHVFTTMSLFMWVLPRVGRIPPLVTKIGGETLTIYGAHYVLLYGTWIGVGLKQLIGYRSLDALPCAILAALFVLGHVFLIKHIDKIRVWWSQHGIPAQLKTRRRRLSVWYHRDYPRLRNQWQNTWQQWLTTWPEWLLPFAKVLGRRK